MKEGNDTIGKQSIHEGLLAEHILLIAQTRQRQGGVGTLTGRLTGGGVQPCIRSIHKERDNRVAAAELLDFSAIVK